MFRKILKLFGLLAFVMFLIASFTFTTLKRDKVECSEIDVIFSSSDLIQLSKEDILGMVRRADNRIIGKDLNKIDLEKIERELYKNRAIKRADVYKVITRDENKYKGVLAVKVYHRKPAVRIMSSQGNYYLDKLGNKIPFSRNYTADVKVITGNLSEEYARESLLPFLLYIQNDKFWDAQIEHVSVTSDGDVYLHPLVGDQVVELGKPENYEEKLRNLLAFYKQVLVKNKWDKYKMVSVKYKDQVIAKRR